MRRAISAVLLVVASASSLACGGASRAVFAQRDFVSVYSDPDGLRALRGVEPTLPTLWIESARIAGIDDTEAGLVRVREGLAFHPSEPTLLLFEVELLESLGEHEQALAAADRGLALLPPQAVRIALVHARLRNQLTLGQIDDAHESTERLAGLIGVPEAAEADAWARVALALTAHGRLDEADACLDRSLARGPNGLGTLASLTRARPAAAAASRTLRERAVGRRPRDPDLLLTLAVDQMQAGSLPEAEAALDALPAPLPARLVPDTQAMKARLALVQGRVDEGLSRLAERLDANPADLPALTVLQEAWANLGRPDDETFARRLLAARALLGASQRQGIDALLATLSERPADIQGPPAPADP